MEKELRRPVEHFLKESGMEVLHEVSINGRIADVVGVSKDLIAIELKLTDWRRGLRQAMSYQLACDRSYLCLPFHEALRMTYKAHYFEKEGVGVLGCLLDSGEVRVIIRARPSRRLLPFLADFLRDSLLEKGCLRLGSDLKD
ncbi:MAG: hypothetical protein ACE5HJ_01505 [Thermoplasmata archaeon]